MLQLHTTHQYIGHGMIWLTGMVVVLGWCRFLNLIFLFVGHFMSPKFTDKCGIFFPSLLNEMEKKKNQ